ncbi:MAG: hypothetical protein RIC95_13135 [Vicingaceae bacterium]
MIEFLEAWSLLPVDFLCYLLLLLLDSLIGIRFYRRFPKSFRLLTQLIILTFLVEFSSESLIQAEKIESNFIFYHLLQVIQLLYYALIYHELFEKLNQGKYKKRALWLGSSLALLCFIISLSIQPFQFFPSYGSLLLSFFVIASSLLYYLKMMKTPSTITILKQAGFWFNSGSFFFYSVTFFVFGYFEFAQGTDKVTPIWVSNLIKSSNFILYLSLGLSLYFATTKPSDGNISGK